MVERFIITLGLMSIGVVVYQGIRWWTIRRASRLAHDPLLSELRPGIPAILYFTADFCGVCQTHQRPALNNLAQQLGESGVQIIQVDAEKNALDAERWGVMSLPTTFILDSNGKPHTVNYGLASADKLRHQLERAS